MKAVNHYVIVEKIKSEQKNIAGLIIHEKIDQEKKYGKAKVISVGNKTEVVTENDIIYFNNSAAHAVVVDDKVYHVLSYGEIIAIE
jgi:co-chaperonin GroES (HSP10)|tara:strand:+ start:2521 stop:2778 length:258 start_codon:yes stop_codon:yes gene_type:complete